jgi:hypothetical protein
VRIGRRDSKWEWIRRIETEWNRRETGMEWDRMKVAGNRLELDGDWKCWAELDPEGNSLKRCWNRRLAVVIAAAVA